MIFLIHGEDDYLSSEKLKFFKNGSIKKYGDFNVTHFDEESINVEKIINEIRSSPFLGEKRVIILEGILTSLKKDEREKIIENSLNSPESTVVIFFEKQNLLPYKVKDRIKEIEKFIEKIDKKDVFYYNNIDLVSLNKWVNSRFSSVGFTIEPKAANGLIALIGNNTRQIDNEIKKLVSYKYKEKKIISDDVIKMVKANLDTGIFSLTDALAKKDIKNSKKILKNIIDSGEDIYGVLGMIAFQFRNLVLIKIAEKENIPQAKILNDTKMNPYVYKKVSQQLRNFSFERLREIYHLIFEADLAIKTGGKEPELALDLLIVNICM
uniref:DNA polymerase III subunit delta n=1 Tax=candidate division CPR3 bacterium TaxID=2268181 RepID=A0A7C4R3B2_UNCC3